MADQMTTDQAVTRGLVQLSELLAFKSREDGVPRAAVGLLGPKVDYDQFAETTSQGI